MFERCAFVGKYNRLVSIKIYKMINLLEEDGVVDVDVMHIDLAGIGVDVAVLVVVVSAKR